MKYEFKNIYIYIIVARIISSFLEKTVDGIIQWFISHNVTSDSQASKEIPTGANQLTVQFKTRSIVTIRYCTPKTVYHSTHLVWVVAGSSFRGLEISRVRVIKGSRDSSYRG